MEKIGEIGEHEAIRRLTNKLSGHALLRTGIGDDCAVVEVQGTGMDQVFTTDPIIENIHFHALENPERIGNKAVGRVLSDMAAMGAQPQWILINVVTPAKQNFKILEKIYEGIHDQCRRFGATVIGGDLAQGPCLELHIFGTGILPSGKALLRSGARPGDCIFVTGPLGCSIEGKHLDFEPKVTEGIFLRETGWVSSMMDISDGLGTDLRHILKQSEVGAVLDGEHIPKIGTLDQALYDGEDFELLLTVPEQHTKSLGAKWMEEFKTPLFMIGRITDQKGQLMIRQVNGCIQSLDRKAFEHFSGKL